MERLVGTTLGRYRIERLLGRGGMAWVYQAHDPAFGRTVAVKVLAPKLSDETQFVERFLREARSMARLQHPHILPVYDVGEQHGTAYLVMLYVDGGSLHERLAATRQGRRLSLRDLLAMIRPIADALDYAHRHGVIHRDVKPQNILLTAQGYPFLTDFGIAKILDASGGTGSSLTQANAVIGTPDYMSPEQGQGMPLDGRSDLYSLGIILYEVFTGRTPFRSQTPAETPLAVMMRHITTPPPPPRGINPQLPIALDAVLLRALAKQPGDRYPTGTALIDALETAVESVRLPQSQGGVATPSLSDFRLPPSPTPPGGQPSFPGGAPSYGGNAAQTPGSGPLSARNATPLPLAPTTVGPMGIARPIGNAQSNATGLEPRRRSLLPLILVGGALAIIILIAVLALRALNGGAAGQTAATSTPGGTAVAAASPPVTATVPGASSAPPSGVASAPASTSAAPSGSASTAPSAPPSGGAGGVATPGGTTKREVILFSSHRNNVHDSQIYTMNTDGSGQRILVNAKGHSWGPRVSPDGKFLVFSTVIGTHNNHTATGGGQQGTGHHEIFRARADGGDIAQITTSADNVWNNAWAWSPDSKFVVFASDRDGNWELYRMAADGSGVTRLTNNPAQDGWPTLTPDGKSIIFASDREGGTSQLYIMDANGQNARRLVFSEAYDTLPSISPDGKTVVYSSQSGSLAEIYLLDLATNATTRLTSTVAMNTDPSFSPDGGKIVFTSDRDGNTNIYVMDRDGKNPKRLTDDPGEDVTPFWAVLEVAATTTAVAPQAVSTHPTELVAALPRRRDA
jgi:eukaryotic-like serine/threonine-protein kinase